MIRTRILPALKSSALTIGKRFFSCSSSSQQLPPLPVFLSPIKIGTDICSTNRIYKILRGPNATRFVARVLTEKEISEAKEKREWFDSVLRQIEGGKEEDEKALKRLSEFLAGRWAAKEAAVKAHPWLRLGLRDVEVVGGGDGEGGDGGGVDRGNGSEAPMVLVRNGEGGKGEEEKQQLGLVSISHDGGFAVGVCVGWEMSKVKKFEDKMENFTRRLKSLEMKVLDGEGGGEKGEKKGYKIRRVDSLKRFGRFIDPSSEGEKKEDGKIRWVHSRREFRRFVPPSSEGGKKEDGKIRWVYSVKRFRRFVDPSSEGKKEEVES